MKQKSLDYYICPDCNQGKLQVADTQTEHPEKHLQDTDLFCNVCDKTFPIIDGIPRFVESENYADSFGYQWNIHARTQLDSYTGLPVSRDRLFGVTGWPESMEGQLILEAGSGSGRFSEILLKTGAELYSFDYSSAINANWSNNKQYSNLNCFQGNIYQIPFRTEMFDKVMCLGVIQHTPDPEKAFMNLTQQVRPGGELVIDVYEKRFVSMLHWRFLLRPFTKNMANEKLYEIICKIVPLLLPFTILLRRFAGRVGARFSPIPEFSWLGLPYELNKQWSILDSFDMYSPVHDHPQSKETVEGWFRQAGFVEIDVKRGPNGIVAKGRKLK